MSFKKLYLSVVAVILVVSVSACSSKSKEVASTSDYLNTGATCTQEDNTIVLSSSYDIGYEDANMTISKPEKVSARTDQKLIKRVSMGLETLEYNSLLSFLDNKIKEVNGYVEQSNSYGERINQKSLQHINMTVRVPNDRLDEFVIWVGENTTVVNKSESTEDITSSYVDTESRKKALEIQLERLFTLLEKAEKIEDVIALEARISDVTYQLENFTASLRTYDNLVDYSSVTLDINEVERVSNPEPKNTWEEMKNGFADTIYDIKEGFQSFGIWVISNLPYLIFWGIVIAGTVIVIQKKLKKRKARKEQLMNTMNDIEGK